VSLGGGRVELPDTEITLFAPPRLPGETKKSGGITIETKGVSIGYDGPRDKFLFTGNATIKDKLAPVVSKTGPFTKAKPAEPTPSFKIDLGDPDVPSNKNFLEVGDGKLSGRGTISIEKVDLVGGFSIENLSATLEGKDNELIAIGGAGKFGIPFGRPLGSEELLGKEIRKKPLLLEANFETRINPEVEIDKVGISLSDISIPVPGVPALLLTSASLSATGLSESAERTPAESATLTGSVGFGYGPEIKGIKLPDFFGLPTVTGQMANLQLTGNLTVPRDTGSLSIGGSGTLNILHPSIFTGTVTGKAGPGAALIDFDKGKMALATSFTLLGTLVGKGNLEADFALESGGPGANDYIAFSGSVTGKLPNVGSFGAFRNLEIASGETYGYISNNGRLDDDTFAVSVSIPLPGGRSTKVGFQVFMDGDVNISKGGLTLPVVGSYDVPTDTEWVMMSASWIKSAEKLPGYKVTYRETVDGPVLETYRKKDFDAAGITVVDSLTHDRAITVFVDDTKAGVWDLELSSEDGLGKVTHSAIKDSEINAKWTRAKQADDEFRLAVDVSGIVKGARIDLYADTDREGYDGTPVALDLKAKEARAGVTWALDDAPAGPLYLYAVVRDPDLGIVKTNYRKKALDGRKTADVEASLAPVGEVAEGAKRVEYTLEITNHGPQEASGVNVVLALPDTARAKVLSASPQLGTVEIVDGLLSADASVLELGETATISLEVRGPKGEPAPELEAAAMDVTTLSFDPFLGANTAPETTRDEAEALPGFQTVISPLANDTDAGSAPLTLTSVKSPKNGKVEVIEDQVIYSPNDGFTGSDRIFYTISDGVLETRGRIEIDVLKPGSALGSIDNHILGQASADEISGRQGNDILLGRTGNDTLIGGSGADMLEGGSGKDSLSGGPGADTFRFLTTAKTGKDVITDFDRGADVVSFVGLTRSDVKVTRDQTDSVVTWDNGELTFEGVADVTKADFLFS
jgi:hypothetical protein